jgi:putative transposase
MIGFGLEAVPVTRLCELLGVARSTFYYSPRGLSEEDLELMRLIDEQYTKTPFYGYRKMTRWLWLQGYHVNKKRVLRLMQKMGLQAIYPKRKLSKPGKGHLIYPYLLRDVKVIRPDQVWAADLTYIRLLRGFIYLVAIMDWYSRYVLSWEVSITLETDFCVAALRRALERGRPEIFNTDQGAQFTSTNFINELKNNEIRISMDGRRRVQDNIFVERLWRTLKYEEVYLKDYETVFEAVEGIRSYFKFYNGERLHQALDYKTPALIYKGSSSGMLLIA